MVDLDETLVATHFESVRLSQLLCGRPSLTVSDSLVIPNDDPFCLSVRDTRRTWPVRTGNEIPHRPAHSILLLGELPFAAAGYHLAAADPVAADVAVEVVHLWLRPFAYDLLRRLGRSGEVIVWTAGLPVYASPVLDLMEKSLGSSVIRHRLYRDTVSPQLGKDLSLLGRPLSRTLIVENSFFAYSSHPFNGVPVPSFDGSAEDVALRDVIALVDSLESSAADARLLLRDRFGGKPIAGQWS